MSTLYDFTLNRIDGRPCALSEYRGKVVLLVNVASQCGYTPQYEGLEALYREFRDRGLVVAGVPSNDFGAQEPGADAEIKTFCESRYDVTFPLFSKLPVLGEAKDPLYAWLTTNAVPAKEVKWNFEKFLIDREGRIVGRFKSGTAPSAPELREAVEKALG